MLLHDHSHHSKITSPKRQILLCTSYTMKFKCILKGISCLTEMYLLVGISCLLSRKSSTTTPKSNFNDGSIIMKKEELTRSIANHQPKKISILCSPLMGFVESETREFKIKYNDWTAIKLQHAHLVYLYLFFL